MIGFLIIITYITFQWNHLQQRKLRLYQFRYSQCIKMSRNQWQKPINYLRSSQIKTRLTFLFSLRWSSLAISSKTEPTLSLTRKLRELKIAQHLNGVESKQRDLDAGSFAVTQRRSSRKMPQCTYTILRWSSIQQENSWKATRNIFCTKPTKLGLRRGLDLIIWIWSYQGLTRSSALATVSAWTSIRGSSRQILRSLNSPTITEKISANSLSFPLLGSLQSSIQATRRRPVIP